MATEYQGVAIYKTDEIHADEFTPVEWEALKAEYQIGEITMPCCNAAAVPKNSPNGLQFFAHYNSDCSTAPETIWHRETKEALLTALSELGIIAETEKVGGSGRRWRADVFFTYHNKNYAIEVQRSYQHLNEYIRRQQRYEEEGIASFWVLKVEEYLSLTKSMVKHRLKHEFERKLPPRGIFPCIQGVPVVYADNDPVQIRGAGLYQSSIKDWLITVVKNRFHWQDGVWRELDLTNGI